jgi:hypothetical protein
MKVLSFEGLVENGCINLPVGISIPDNTKVYVIVPSIPNDDEKRIIRVSSPRLANPEDAKKLVMKLVDDIEEK